MRHSRKKTDLSSEERPYQLSLFSSDPYLNAAPIEYISIKNLFGVKDVNINFKTPCKILIGENGMGKTTILSIINDLLTCKFQQIAKYNYSSIEIKLNNSDLIRFTDEDIASYNRGYRYLIEDIDETNLCKAEKIIFNQIGNKELSGKNINSIIHQTPKLIELLTGTNVYLGDNYISFIESLNNIFSYKKALYNLNLNILYLPTYRRVEADVDSILNPISDRYEDDNNLPFPLFSRDRYDSIRYFKQLIKQNPMIKFGMEDIEKQLKTIIADISKSFLEGFTKVSGDMIKHLIYENQLPSPPNLKKDEISIILARAGENMEAKDRDQILDLIESNKIYDHKHLLYFLHSLLSIYNKQKAKDTQIKRFIESCNNFLGDKEFIYDESNLKIGLYFKNEKRRNNPIPLNKLSSGEKQIISIIAMVYLNDKKKYIILIDEPELSLSIYWQKEFLPTILKGEACKMLIAVTHSPFIFDNELNICASGSSEYISLINEE